MLVWMNVLKIIVPSQWNKMILKYGMNESCVSDLPSSQIHCGF